MAGDGERLAGARQRCDGVVDGAVAQQGGVALRVQRELAAHALLHQPVEIDARDAQAANRVARFETTPVDDGEPADELLPGDAVRARVDVGALDEGRALLAIRGVEA